MAEVSLAGVSKVYDGGVRAVDKVNLTVPDQSFTVLVGPSGCGKSTLLRMIAGLEEISEGEMTIDGARVNETAPRDRDIAMVFQNYALYPHMSVYENMAFSLKMRRASAKEIDERVREAADMLGLDKLLDRRPKALSGGQRQRVAVGRAIVRKPKVFLFDEPLSNLDAKMRVQTRAELVRLHRRLNATMIYVTHDQAEAMTMGDQIVVLRDGRVQQIAAPISVYNHPANAFVAGFIGSPPMNFLKCTLVASGGPARLRCEDNGVVAIEAALWDAAREAIGTPHDGRAILLGIRPEDVRPSPPVDGAPYAQVEATVEVVEQMGAEQFVSLRIASSAFVARLEPDVEVRPDDRRTFFLNLGKARLFDPDTEEALGPRS
ncbi:MAG: sn-glycerol-3-phosphate ABC transporter ATP-binding protein UgpC [Blastocatellia bacterium]|nr:sn-glycerol-3-phosphate ABC transporter ATP-binding protein UgpC [Blastocatellia bacterium]MBK6427881.1 sn-glycerol-3-phosphate ABC transporter ATP-binding protein UgpC [Blastocatellia bacterium]